MSGSIAEEHRQTTVRQGHEIVDVPPDRVGDLVVSRDLVILRVGHLLGDQVRLEIAGQLQLITKAELVDQLHRQQEREH